MQPISLYTQLTIKGGSLKRVWSPINTTSLGSQIYIPLQSQDYLLHEFCGKSLRNGSFLNYLKERRNLAVDKMILRKMHEADANTLIMELPKGAKKLFDPAQLDKTVKVEIPQLGSGAEISPPFEIEMLMELNGCKSPTILCDAETLQWLWQASRSFKVDAAPCKRKSYPGRLESGYSFIKYDGRRESFWTCYKNRDGVVRKRWKKPRSQEPSEIDAVCNGLIEFLSTDHYVDTIEGGRELASVVNADMFALEGEQEPEEEDAGSEG